MTISNPFADFAEEREVARLAGLSPRTLKRWRDMRSGPPFVKLGRKILYRRDAVSAWLLSREQIQPRASIRP